MEENAGTAGILKILKDVSVIDGALAAIAAERKTLQEQIEEKRAVLRERKEKHSDCTLRLDDKQSLYRKEEKRLKEERDKLIERRKALTTLSNYKLQQAASKEIEFASKQLDTHEESLVAVLDEIEEISGELEKCTAEVEELEKDWNSFSEEADATLKTLEGREGEKGKEREKLSSDIPPESLVEYDKIVARFPGNAVVSVEKNTCTGCYMQLGPQVLVQIARGDNIIKCRGCGRILFLEESANE